MTEEKDNTQVPVSLADSNDGVAHRATANFVGGLIVLSLVGLAASFQPQSEQPVLTLSSRRIYGGISGV